MKASTRIRKVYALQENINNLLQPINEALEELLGDDSAHIAYSTDGYIVAYGLMNNSSLCGRKIDELLAMKSREKALAFLDKNRI